MKGQYKGSGQASVSSIDAPKKDHFYALRYRGEQQSSPDVVTSMVDRKFDIFFGILNGPFMLTTPVGELVVAKRVYGKFPIMFPNRVTHVELVKLDMFDFDVLLRMDW